MVATKVLQSSDVVALSLAGTASAGGRSTMTGRELMERGLPVKLAQKTPQIVWIIYQRADK